MATRHSTHGATTDKSDEHRENAQDSGENNPWIKNMDFVNAAFKYQQEAIEQRLVRDIGKLSHEKEAQRIERIKFKKIGHMLEINKRLKEESRLMSDEYEQIRNKLKHTNNTLEENTKKIKTLTELLYVLANCGVRGQPIPEDIKDKCKALLEFREIVHGPMRR